MSVGTSASHQLDPNERRAKRTARASVGPLGALVISAFLPMINTCSEVESVAEISLGDPLELGSWVAPPFVAAAFLLVLTVVALRRGRPSLASTRAATFAVALSALSALGVAVIWLWEVDPGEPSELAYVAWPTLAVLAAGVALWRSRRMSGWCHWGSIGLAHALVTTHFMTWLIPAGIEHLSGESAQIGSGAVVYAISTMALVVMWRVGNAGALAPKPK